MAHLLISQDYLNKKSIIPSNVEWALIEPIIELAQVNDLMPLLGSDYYDELITQSTAPTSFTGLNQTLLDTYVVPCLTHYFLARATPFFKFRYSNKGVVERNSANSQPISTDDIKYVVDLHKNTAEGIADRMQKYLRLKGASQFPTYFSSNNQTLIPPANEAFDCPIYLEDNRPINPYPSWGDIR